MDIMYNIGHDSHCTSDAISLFRCQLEHRPSAVAPYHRSAAYVGAVVEAGREV